VKLLNFLLFLWPDTVQKQLGQLHHQFLRHKNQHKLSQPNHNLNLTQPQLELVLDLKMGRNPPHHQELSCQKPNLTSTSIQQEFELSKTKLNLNLNSTRV
jgi:hypothetical protein